MKKAFCLALLLALCLICCACGEDASVIPTESTPTQEETVPTTPIEKDCEHEYKIVESVSATCTQTGNLVYQCNKCDHQYQVEQPKLVHYFTGGSCTEVSTCILCGEVGTAPTGHTYDDNNSCILCGFEKDSQNPCSHEYKITNTVNASCNETGIVYYQCIKCDQQYQVEQPKLVHCFAGGSCTTANICTLCGESEGDPRGHTYDANDICTRCGHRNFSHGLDYTASSAGTGYIVTGIGTCLDKEIVIPKMYQGMPVTGIGKSAFVDCIGLTSITIPDNVTSIGYRAFEGCTSLTNITIPDSVTSIGGLAFVDCIGLTSITIPDSVTSIGDEAFRNCTGLTSITLLANVTRIGLSVFSGCTGLTSITIPGSVASIGNWACYGCTGLISIIIPDSVTTIRNGAFSNCTSLTNISIPNNVISIGDKTFMDCAGLTSITIPSTITSIGELALYRCTGLTSITFNGSKAQWEAIEKGDYWDDKTGDYVIYCTDGEITK